MITTPIMIVGPGAVGCLLAARMAHAGMDVCLLDYRQDRAARMQAIRLTDGEHCKDIPIHVTADPAVAGECNHIIVCVKSFQTATVAEQIAPFVTPETRILSLQNGLGNLETLQQALSTRPSSSRGRSPSKCEHAASLNGRRASSRAGAAESVFEVPPCRDLRPGVMQSGARLVGEGHVRATGGNRIEIAGTDDETVAQQWQQVLQRAGFDARLEPDVQRMLWTKLVLNAAINPVTALYRIPNGQLPTHPEAFSLAHDLLVESAHIARTSGINLDSDDRLQQQLLAICEATGQNRSSMLCDVEAGRPTEIDAINGTVLCRARAHGRHAPVTEKLLTRF